MNKLEKQYKADGCDVSLTRLRRNGDFLAPLDMHSKIKDSLRVLAQICDTSFSVNEPGFEVLVSKEPQRLFGLVKSKCFLEKSIETHRIYIPLPKSQIPDVEDGEKQTQSASASASATSNSTSVNISHSTVSILTGDLTAQPVSDINLQNSWLLHHRLMFLGHFLSWYFRSLYILVTSSNSQKAL